MGNLLQKLQGNNRIVALGLILVVGAVQGLTGTDLSQYLGYLLTMIGVDPNFPKEYGIDLNLTQLLFGVYAFFAIANAIYKRKTSKDEKGQPK